MKLDEEDDKHFTDDALMPHRKSDGLIDILNGMNGMNGNDDITDLISPNQASYNNKKRHLIPQESISDTDFFSRFDGPGLKNLNKQESIIEEEEATYGTIETKPTLSRTSTTREVSLQWICLWISFFLLFGVVHFRNGNKNIIFIHIILLKFNFSHFLVYSRTQQPCEYYIFYIFNIFL